MEENTNKTPITMTRTEFQLMLDKHKAAEDAINQLTLELNRMWWVLEDIQKRALRETNGVPLPNT